MLELNKIYCMDCLDGMKQIPDNSIDLVLTDPPYGIGESMKDHQSRGKYGWGGKKSGGKQLAIGKDYGYSEWDKDRPTKDYFDEILRVSKNQIIFGGNYFTDYLYPSRCWIVWDKDNGDNDFADCELLWTSFDKAVRKFTWKKMGMLQEDMRKHKKEVWEHPTQKPTELCRWILEKYSKEGDTVLDPFMGSGTTAVACKQLRRNFIGFELSQKYVDISNKRLQQDTLFNYNIFEESVCV